MYPAFLEDKEKHCGNKTFPKVKQKTDKKSQFCWTVSFKMHKSGQSEETVGKEDVKPSAGLKDEKNDVTVTEEPHDHRADIMEQASLKTENPVLVDKRSEKLSASNNHGDKDNTATDNNVIDFNAQQCDNVVGIPHQSGVLHDKKGDVHLKDVNSQTIEEEETDVQNNESQLETDGKGTITLKSNEQTDGVNLEATNIKLSAEDGQNLNFLNPLPSDRKKFNVGDTNLISEEYKHGLHAQKSGLQSSPSGSPSTLNEQRPIKSRLFNQYKEYFENPTSQNRNINPNMPKTLKKIPPPVLPKTKKTKDRVETENPSQPLPDDSGNNAGSSSELSISRSRQEKMPTSGQECLDDEFEDVTAEDAKAAAVEESERVQKIFGTGKREYIKKKWRNFQLLYSCQFIESLASCEMRIKLHGSENLLTVDMGSFVSRIQIRQAEELDFTKHFKSNKDKLLQRITITKILEDKLLERRNEAYNMFKKTLGERSKQITDDLDCAEDILQIYILSEHFKSAPKLRPRPSDVFQDLMNNKHISSTLKEMVENVLTTDADLDIRNKHLPQFSDAATPVINDILSSLSEISKEGIANHKKNLFGTFNSDDYVLLCHLSDIDKLSEEVLLYLRSTDIKLFADIAALNTHQGQSRVDIIPPEFISSLWKSYFKRVKSITKQESVKELGSLTNPVYLFLFKSFRELMLEINGSANIPSGTLFRNENGKFRLADSIAWSTDNPINCAVEHQCRLIYTLMKHFKPGKSTRKDKFKYEMKLLGNKNKSKNFKSKLEQMLVRQIVPSLPEERLVWLYILDCGLEKILLKVTNEQSLDLAVSLFRGFEKFVLQAQNDRYESFRIAAKNITKFAAQICPYVSKIEVASRGIDHSILDKQIKFISDMLISEDSHLVFNHFASLIDLYNEYWKHRETVVGEILDHCPCSVFQDIMREDIRCKLLMIVDEALSRKVTVQFLIHFFRLYNEFLEHFKAVNFKWLVSEKSMDGFLSKYAVQVPNVDKNIYIISRPESFIQFLQIKNIPIPKHFVIEVIKQLLITVGMSLEKQNWSDCDRLKAAGDLFLAIGHSLIHFKDQADYIDFENFLTDCTLPFSNVIMNSNTYENFKTRLDNVENFYLYTRKQSEIGIEKALELCVKESKGSIENDFSTDINKSLLKECYNTYLTKFTHLVNTDIKLIIIYMRKELENFAKIDKWTHEFKQNKLPSLLAGLSAVWTILESEDVAGIGKRIEPHCVQILCILRLLGVDQKSKGIDKHLAQVLTGQGKSIVLGLLSSLLAVTGHEVYTVCYSQYLAKRDKLAFTKLFQAFSDFRLQSLVTYNTIDNMANNLLKTKLNGREENLRTLVEKLILDDLPAQNIDSFQKAKCTALLIDEVDVFFSENFYGNTYDPCVCVSMPALLEIQPKLWDIVERGVCEKDAILDEMNEFINEILRDAKHEEFKNFIKNTNYFFKEHLEKMISQAINVSNAKTSNNTWYINKYKLSDDGIISFRDRYGLYTTSVFNGYYNVFNYFRLKKTDYDYKDYENYGYLIVTCGYISYSKLPIEYPVILGVSGTLTTLNSSEKKAIKSYGINRMSVMPSFFGQRKLDFQPTTHFVVEDTEENWLNKIFGSVNDKIEFGRATIVFFDTEIELKFFDEKFRSKIDRLHILTGNEEEAALEWHVNEAGVAQTVTLATRSMGRGVDFKSNDLSVESKGGVHVIQTFFSLDVKEEEQHKGRTARKDNKGSYELILCRNHLKDIGCSKQLNGNPVTSYKQLCAVRRTKADSKGIAINDKIEKSELKHGMTMKFLKSFVDYSPEKRKKYFTKYPFVQVEEKTKQETKNPN